MPQAVPQGRHLVAARQKAVAPGLGRTQAAPYLPARDGHACLLMQHRAQLFGRAPQCPVEGDGGVRGNNHTPCFLFCVRKCTTGHSSTGFIVPASSIRVSPLPTKRSALQCPQALRSRQADGTHRLYIWAWFGMRCPSLVLDQTTLQCGVFRTDGCHTPLSVRIYEAHVYSTHTFAHFYVEKGCLDMSSLCSAVRQSLQVAKNSTCGSQ